MTKAKQTGLLLVILIASVLGAIVIVWLISRKFKCYQINQLIGKRWANSHDL